MTNKERMNQIGELMDKLIELGFKFGVLTLSTMNRDCEDKSKYLSIYFSDDNIVIIDWLGNVIFENKYLPNWQQDVLNKLKELISD
jgi:hypothetical protein